MMYKVLILATLKYIRTNWNMLNSDVNLPADFGKLRLVNINNH